MGSASGKGARERRELEWGRGDGEASHLASITVTHVGCWEPARRPRGHAGERPPRCYRSCTYFSC